MRSFAPREAMTTAEQTEALLIVSNPTCHVPPAIFSIMADVCEAFLFILCVLWTNDEHSCPFVSISGS